MKFDLDKSGEISYLKSSRKLNNLIDNLNNKKRLTIEAEPYSEPSITVDFDITELKKYLNELSNLCIN
jgi:ribosome assembly protein YihI (activator of Der GTPase)